MPDRRPPPPLPPALPRHSPSLKIPKVLKSFQKKQEKGTKMDKKSKYHHHHHHHLNHHHQHHYHRRPATTTSSTSTSTSTRRITKPIQKSNEVPKPLFRSSSEVLRENGTRGENGVGDNKENGDKGGACTCPDAAAAAAAAAAATNVHKESSHGGKAAVATPSLYPSLPPPSAPSPPPQPPSPLQPPNITSTPPPLPLSLHPTSLPGDRELSDLLTCPVCMEEYEPLGGEGGGAGGGAGGAAGGGAGGGAAGGGREPLFLHCHHSLCRTCLPRLIRTHVGKAGKETVEVTCPQCRVVTLIPPGGLIQNFYLVSLIEAKRRRPKDTGSRLRMWCETCDRVALDVCANHRLSHLSSVLHSLSHTYAVTHHHTTTLLKARVREEGERVRGAREALEGLERASSFLRSRLEERMETSSLHQDTASSLLVEVQQMDRRVGFGIGVGQVGAGGWGLLESPLPLSPPLTQGKKPDLDLTGNERLSSAFLTSPSGIQAPRSAPEKGSRLAPSADRYSSGLEKYSPGSEKYYSGLEKYRSGMEKYSIGLERSTSRPERHSSGLETYSAGLERSNSGPDRYSSGLEKYSSGLERSNSSPGKCCSDLWKYTSGLEKYSAGAEKIDSGLEKFNSRIEKYSFGTEKRHSGLDGSISTSETTDFCTERKETLTDKSGAGIPRPDPEQAGGCVDMEGKINLLRACVSCLRAMEGKLQEIVGWRGLGEEKGETNGGKGGGEEGSEEEILTCDSLLQMFTRAVSVLGEG